MVVHSEYFASRIMSLALPPSLIATGVPKALNLRVTLARTSFTVLDFISGTVPTCTMRRLASIAMRSDTVKALCMSWVTTMEVQCSLARMLRIS